jgi:hypothetical protein
VAFFAAPTGGALFPRSWADEPALLVTDGSLNNDSKINAPGIHH